MTCKEALQATAVTGYLEMVHSVCKEDGLKRQREHIARVLELQRDQSPHEVYQGKILPNDLLSRNSVQYA